MTIIKVDKPTKVSEIKKIFNNEFPFLKIEFFRKAHKTLQGSLKKDVIIEDFTLLPLNPSLEIIINSEMSVSEFEKQMFDKFNLSVQVFRKSSGTWLETTFTDGWTLKKQNEEGLELSNI